MFGASQFPRPLICKSDHRCSVPLTTDGSGRKPSRTHKSKRTNVHHHQAHLLNILFQLVCKRDDENALDVVLEGRMKNRPEQTREMGRFYEDVHFKRTHLNTWKHAKIKQRTRRQNDSHVDKAALHNSTHLPTTQTAEKQGVVKTSVCSLEKEKKKMLTLLLSRSKRVQVVVLVGYNYQTARKSDESRGYSKKCWQRLVNVVIHLLTPGREWSNVKHKSVCATCLLFIYFIGSEFLFHRHGRKKRIRARHQAAIDRKRSWTNSQPTLEPILRLKHRSLSNETGE